MPEPYNPFALDVNTDEPTFVNEIGVRWWQLDVGDPQDGIAYRVDGPAYVIVKDRRVIYETMSLEQLCFQFDIYRLNREIP